MNKLDAIRARAHAYAEHGTPGLAAPSDRRALLAAVDALTDLADSLATHPGDIPPIMAGIMIRASITEALEGK